MPHSFPTRRSSCLEECLFFVALSRARTHLRLYHARKQRNGNGRSPSPYLKWLPGGMVQEIPNPPRLALPPDVPAPQPITIAWPSDKSEEHTSELQSLMRISYAVFCLKKKNK